jgi:ribosomal protein S18 acetylase RimI-like enzyme
MVQTLGLRPASDFSRDALAGAFTAAYAGYFLPVTMTAGTLETHITTNDIALDRSFVAQAPDGALEGIALLSVRGARGWVGGVGVAPAWRGKGWGAALMRALIEEARALGLHSVQLEVLEQNTVARHLYERLGFVTTRRLDIFTGPLTELPAAAPGDGSATAVPVPIADALAAYAALDRVTPPWQREPATLSQLAARNTAIQAIAITREAAVHATLIYAAARDSGPTPSLTLYDLASRGTTTDERREHGLTLFQHAFDGQLEAIVRAVNIPPGDPLGELLRELGCPVVMSQLELLLDLG